MGSKTLDQKVAEHGNDSHCAGYSWNRQGCTDGKYCMRRQCMRAAASEQNRRSNHQAKLDFSSLACTPSMKNDADCVSPHIG